MDDRVKGRVVHGTNPGPPTALTAKEEKALVSYLLYVAERGLPLTTTMARAFAWAVSYRSGTQSRFNEELGPGKHWWEGFRSQHPELSLRTPDNLERSQANAMTREVVDNYFVCLKKTLDVSGLEKLPCQIFNCDETFLPLNISSKKVIALKNSKHVYSVSRGNSDHITLLCCASEAGIVLPPMIIYSKSFSG